jgi:6-phosphogluconate dehydrogenase
MSVARADIGLIGLAVMGQNVVLNMNDHGYVVAVFNRTVSKVDEFLANEAKGTNVIGTHSIEEFCAALKKPRRVMLLVKAGKPVDDFIELLLPHLEPGDIIIDGGNSHFPDTIRRAKYLESKGFLFIGTGVSGGEEGARRGPSIMPGGSAAAWPHVKEIFQSIAAKTPEGEPCCDWVGEDGAGHYVKMVHNGIEYGDMQLIAEAYHLMKEGLGLSNQEMHEIFARWNEGPLDSYLIEITRDILATQDESGRYVLDLILDTAGQKGTGKWTGVSALELGVPMTLVTEAVFSRVVSSLKDERIAASKILKGPALSERSESKGPSPRLDGDRQAVVDDIGRAIYASKIVSYAQGYMLMREAASEYQWHINYGGVALMWRGGCIIRSRFLGKIRDAFAKNPDLHNLLLDDFFRSVIDESQASWRRVVARGAEAGIPIPAMAAALTFFDGYRHAWLPANLVQAQRDYFGAHTYERVDQPRGKFFHTNWTGRGGRVASTSYSA